MKFLFLFVFILLNTPNLFGKLSGQAKIDSLLKELPKMKEDTNAVNLLNDLSLSLYSTNSDKGIEIGLKGLKLAKDIDWKKGEAKCYSTLGVGYEGGKSDYPKALEYYYKSLKIYEELGDKRSAAGTIHNIGIIYYFQSDYPKALEYYHKALKINEQEGGNKIWLANNLGNIGLIYDYQSDYPKALEYYHKSLKIMEELENKSGIASNLGNIGVIYDIQSDYPKALEYYFKALNINEELGDKRSAAVTIQNIGVIYSYQSDYPKALEYYHKALNINEELGDKRSAAGTIHNIGVIYSSQSDYPKALEYYHKALNINEEIGNKSGIASVIVNIGLINQYQLDYPKALEYYHKALKIFEEIGNKYGMASNLGNMGLLYYELSKDSVLSNISEGTGLVSLKKGINLNKSIEYSLQSIKLYEEIGELDDRSKVLNNLANAYAQKRDYKNSDKYIREHIVLKDSVFNQEKSKELGKLEATHEIELAQKEEEVKEKEKVRMLAEVTSRRDNLQYSIITIITLFAFVVVYYLSRKNISFGVIDTLTFLSFLLIYEFILVFADPIVDDFTSGIPLYKLGINFGIALIFIPLHKIEQRFKEKLKEKDNVIT